jgi:hypothetical protein
MVVFHVPNDQLPQHPAASMGAGSMASPVGLRGGLLVTSGGGCALKSALKNLGWSWHVSYDYILLICFQWSYVNIYIYHIHIYIYHINHTYYLMLCSVCIYKMYEKSLDPFKVVLWTSWCVHPTSSICGTHQFSWQKRIGVHKNSRYSFFPFSWKFSEYIISAIIIINIKVIGYIKY